MQKVLRLAAIEWGYEGGTAVFRAAHGHYNRAHTRKSEQKNRMLALLSTNQSGGERPISGHVGATQEL